jgi:hypothetical protein
VDATELYPDVKYTTVDEYLNRFLWKMNKQDDEWCGRPNRDEFVSCYC